MREELEHRLVGPADVRRIAGQGDPPERAAALAELGPDEGRHEPRVVERVVDAGLLGLGAQVVAVVEHDRARRLEGEHRADVVGHGAHRALHVHVRLGDPEHVGVVERDLGRQVARQRVVRGGLVGDHVEPLAGLRPRRLDLGRVADQRDRDRLAGGRRLAGHRQRLLRGVGQPVDVADLVPPPGTVLVDLDRDAHALVHGHGQGLRAAHPAEPGGEGHACRGACRRSAGGRSSANVSYVPWRIPWVPM